MRTHDDYGFSLEWVDETLAFASENVATLRRAVNDLAKRDQACFETGFSGGKWNNLAYSVSNVGHFLRMIDQYQDKMDEKGRTIGLNVKFLEVGCGSGVKAVMASQIFAYMSEGFDIRPDYVSKAVETAALFKDKFSVFWDGDAWAQAVVYSNADVVYLNQLFTDPDEQHRIEQYIRDNMSQYAYLIGVNNISSPADWELVHEQPFAYVARKP